LIRKQALLILASILAVTGCQSLPETPHAAAVKAANTAQRLQGTPYRYGGANPRGFDCSGLVWYSYHQAGIALPRTSRQQREVVVRVKRKQLLPGDLVFFRGWIRTGHVGIYVGQGRFVHAPSRGRRVTSESLKSGYWHDHFSFAGRVVY
jgi:cell wall-associated NlpC family hydrolase